MHREPDHHRTVDCGEGLHVSLRQFCIWKFPIPQRGEVGQGRTTGEQIHTVCLGWSHRLLCGLRVKAYSTPTHYATREGPVHFRRRGADKSLVSLKRTNAELCKGSFKFAKYIPHLIFKNQIVSELFLNNIYLSIMNTKIRTKCKITKSRRLTWIIRLK